MHRCSSSTRLIAALTIVLIVALVVPAIVSAAPVPFRVGATNAGSSAALASVAEEHALDAKTAAVAAEAAALAEQQRIAAAALVEKERLAAAAYTAARTSAKKPAAKTAKISGGSELTQAQSILASLRSRYPRYLSGATVSIGSAKGYQAISYYTSGRIVISPTHRASLERILAHEIWHIIDWRDNGRIDWGERVPPSNAASYR
ncbi:MAG: hypothetical protein Q7W16_07655 [Coriobacteriia bacterium]|nr:hypothetical protein [Coriobacteriia bacterium]